MKLEEMTIFQLLLLSVLIPLIIYVLLKIWEITSNRIEKIFYTWIFLGFVFFCSIVLISECSLYPFSKHDCYCLGYKNASGKWPFTCTHK